LSSNFFYFIAQTFFKKTSSGDVRHLALAADLLPKMVALWQQFLLDQSVEQRNYG
jgi:hypothetical protein